jgi:tetratricopeptide (TPR) repeat protein
MGGGGGRFSTLLLEGLDHYRKGRMLEAVRAWEEAYLLEPTNLRAREFLRSALERIHAHMTPGEGKGTQPGAPAAHPWLPGDRPEVEKTQAFSLPPPPPPPTPPAGNAPVKPAPAAKPPPKSVAQKPAVGEKPAAAEKATAADKPAAAAKPAAAKPRPVAKPAPKAVPKPPPPPPTTPWDDGPSVALPVAQSEDWSDETSGAWSIHKEALPNEAIADDEAEVWMRGARELLALNDFSGALELLAKVLERKPSHKEAGQLHEVCEQNLTLMYESKIGAMEARPRTAIPPDEIIWLNLDPRAGFVLAQIDGEVSFDDLYAICGLKRLDTARILCELLEQGVVQVDGSLPAIAKRTLRSP